MFKNSEAFCSFSVNDLKKAHDFYGTTLGLDVSEKPEGLEMRLASGATIFIYPKPDHVPATFTILNFQVANIEAAVDELVKRGMHFEHYDQGELKTDSKGIAHTSGPTVAWFKDPAGNFLSVIQEK